MAGEGDSQPDWVALASLKQAILVEFEAQGVNRVEYVIAFSEPFKFWVWLGTESDTERDALGTDDTIDRRIRAVAQQSGVHELFQGSSFESQETLDREFEGSWFYRLR